MEEPLPRLDPQACRAMADYHRRLAARLDAAAELGEADDRATARRRARSDLARRLGERVARAVENGHAADRAIAVLARRAGIDPAQLRAWWQIARRKRRAAGRKPGSARDLEILRLAARGWTDAQLAARFKLDRSTVNRIVRRTLAGTSTAAMPPPPAPVGPPPLPPRQAQRGAATADAAHRIAAE